MLPDGFAVDCTEKAVHPTVIQNNVNALSLGGKIGMKDVPPHDEYFGTDEGPQALRMALALDARADEPGLESALMTLQRPLHIWDDYRGVTRLERFRVRRKR